ncbi:MAG: hypothetical protein LCH41_10130 [Armatimonadetes bacterium]|nr:hypothetical protein [Armatimonadota bacterium]
MKKVTLFLLVSAVMLGVVACNGGEPAPVEGSAPNAPAATDAPETTGRADSKQATTGVDPNDPAARGRR